LLAVLLAAPIHAQERAQQTKEQDKMSESTGFALNKIGQISIGVKDLDRATEFYRDKLGVKHLLKAPSVSVSIVAESRCCFRWRTQPLRSSTSKWTTFKKAFETLKSRGVKMEEKPHVVGQLGKNGCLDCDLPRFRREPDVIEKYDLAAKAQ